jgi:hydrogenase nickel incorporation protein HypB
MHVKRVKVVQGVLDANNTIAAANRADFDRTGVRVVNFMSAPGAGKTTLLECALERLEVLESDLRVAVLQGDVQGSLDAERLARFHDVPVAQINTDSGFGGECHLDANMVRSALPSLPLGEIDLLVIENVGNLVCPAEFRVGEDARVMVCSVTEGEDKPLKYPLMFRACDLVLVNKIDLLPHLEFDLARLLANIRAVHPGVAIAQVSARTGEGLDHWVNWLLKVAGRAPRAAMVDASVAPAS